LLLLLALLLLLLLLALLHLLLLPLLLLLLLPLLLLLLLPLLLLLLLPLLLLLLLPLLLRLLLPLLVSVLLALSLAGRKGTAGRQAEGKYADVYQGKLPPHEVPKLLPAPQERLSAGRLGHIQLSRYTLPPRP